MGCGCGDRALNLVERMRGMRGKSWTVNAPADDRLVVVTGRSGTTVTTTESFIRRHHFRYTLLLLCQQILFLF